MSTFYLDILKASYDYEPQSEDEIALKEDQVLFLIERIDEDWWKVKVKDAVDETEGLIPAAYVEQSEHISQAKALYTYEANAPGELAIQEDEILLVYQKDEDWWLVKKENEEKAGYVPGSYLEDTAPEEKQGESDEPQALNIIVPPSPPRPTSVYVDPADRVAASKAHSDDIQTWSISEVDKKGKKKKGTLGVGNGSIFFASESDKTPVQKWQISDIDSVKVEKSKHIHIDIGGLSSTNLHFNTGSKDVADAIAAKIESSRGISAASLRASSPSVASEDDHKAKKNGISVHFSNSPVAIIPPRDPSDDEGDNGEEEDPVEAGLEGANAVVLYDFDADGEDELSVKEGQQLIVLDTDNEDWWKCRDVEGREGVVPASYVESKGPLPQTSVDHEAQARIVREQEERTAREAEEAVRLEADRKARERMEAESVERERKKAEVERKRLEAERAAKAAAEERRRRELEAQERAEAEKRRKEEKRRSEACESNKESKSASSPPADSGGGRTSTDSRRGPAPKRTRTWHDRSGQFQVDAEFLGYNNGKIRLHKVNGVVIEVPAEKMSEEDMRFIEKLSKRSSAPPASPSEDDEPLSERKRSLQPEKKSSIKVPPTKKPPSVDWFEFFLSAGCDVDDCTRYASSFERDKIDESILADITDQTMRSLGLREGDIIRVKKAITQKIGAASGADEAAVKEQLRKDEELARKLHAEVNGGRSSPQRQSSSPAPNLFASPDGVLKSNVPRRKRPQPSKTPPLNVDLDIITSASEQINSGGSSGGVSTSALKPVQAPPRSSSVAPVVNGFEDDAWAVRPSSTKPSSTPTIETVARAPSVPPPSVPQKISSPPAPAAAFASPPPAVATPPAQPAVPSTTSSLARTTESDVFEQLARLSQLRTQSPVITPTQPTNNAFTPPINSTSPLSIQQGLGVGSSPLPLSQHLQSLPTGVPLQQSFNAPRGPYAPVPTNQGLLQPLVPTKTGFSGFIPTRPSSSPSYQPPSFQPSPQQQYPPPSFQQPQQSPSFLSTQPTGFSGFAPPIPFSQSTGFSANVNGFNGISPIQPAPTGYNSFSPLPFNNSTISPPPSISPIANNNTTTTSPANVFAQMKSGTFGAEGTPQSSEKYDALRPQPTGWGYQGFTGIPNGYGYTS